MLIDRTKTKPQETLEFRMNKQMQIFLFHLQLTPRKKVNGY